MLICRITGRDRRPEYALYRPGQVCPLRRISSEPPVETELFGRGPNWFDGLPEPSEGDWEPAPETLLPPIPPPEKILCIGLNYRDHAIETGAEIPEEPVVFSKFNTAIIGHGSIIRLPRVSQQVDYEAELVVVIGKAARHVDRQDAMAHVFGYTCGHDVSARDWQKGRPGGQWLLGKSFDTFAPLGPCLALAGGIPDPGNLRVRMRLNGDTVQDSTTAQLIFDIPTLIAHLSTILTLNPGDVIFTGTPPGVGAARNPPRFLQNGDRCEVEIEGIGSLANGCAPE